MLALSTNIYYFMFQLRSQICHYNELKHNNSVWWRPLGVPIHTPANNIWPLPLLEYIQDGPSTQDSYCRIPNGYHKFLSMCGMHMSLKKIKHNGGTIIMETLTHQFLYTVLKMQLSIQQYVMI